MGHAEQNLAESGPTPANGLVMERFGSEGVLYSRDYFDEETLRDLLEEADASQRNDSGKPDAGFFELSNEQIIREIEKAPLAFGPSPKTDVESSFSDAWDMMLADPEFASAFKQGSFTKAQGLEEFKRGLAAPVTKATDARNSKLLKLDYSTKIENDAYVHRIDGKDILRIPCRSSLAAASSAAADRAVLIAFIVVDVLSVIAAVAGVVVAYNKEVVAKALKGVLGAFRKLFNSTTVRRMKELAKQKKFLDIIFKILAMLRGKTSLKDVVVRFASSLGAWKKALAVIQLVAAIGLAIASAGATLTASFVALSASLTILGTDIAELVFA